MPRNIQFKVGLFIIITSVMIVAFIGYVAYKKGVFAKEHTYTLSSKSGENLTEGMPVVSFLAGLIHWNLTRPALWS